MKTPMWNGIALAVGVVALAALGPVLVRAIGSLPRAERLAARANARVVTLEVGGMTCAGCASRVRSELESVSGVTAVEVRLGAERAIVLCERGVADSALVAAVHRAGPGFTAGPARR